MKTSLLAVALMLQTPILFAHCATPAAQESAVADPQESRSTARTKVQVALLLDTSNSMDGLIDQAKSRLWNIINTLTTLRYQGKAPVVEIALYEYGNDGLSPEGNYIRQVTPLTADLDLISEKLFALHTNGGNEYCGAVISQAVRQLEWGHNESDMKLVYIAGNEPFDQGHVSYKEAVAGALSRNIFINTIFCGSRSEGISTHWKDGADRGKGKYFHIDSDRKVRFVETPYDARIRECNERMNKTYVSYGSQGDAMKSKQVQQDRNAGAISSANFAERTVTKSKSAYKNSNWDLVDRVKDDKQAISQMKEEELPGEYKGKSRKEIEAAIAEKAKERESIQKEIESLGRQRQAYMDAEHRKQSGEDDLGAAISSSLLSLAGKMGYTTEK